MSSKWFEVQVTCHKLVAVEIEDQGTDALNEAEAQKVAMDETFGAGGVIETGECIEMNSGGPGNRRGHYDEIIKL